MHSLSCARPWFVAQHPAELSACCPCRAGTRLTASRWLLFRYALYSRLASDPHVSALLQFSGNTSIPAAVWRCA